MPSTYLAPVSVDKEKERKEKRERPFINIRKNAMIPTLSIRDISPDPRQRKGMRN